MEHSLENDEDLLADATALVERAQLELPTINNPFIFGFRTNGALSLFFEDVAVYHFNQRDELRRIFLCGKRYKAEEGQLLSVDRIPQTRGVRLQSAALNPEQTDKLLCGMNQRLDVLDSLFDAGRYQIIEKIPKHVDIIARLHIRIPELLQNRIAQAPYVGA